MGNKDDTGYKTLKGSKNFRQRLLLATLTSTPIIIEDIRTDETWPGLRNYEISLLRLFESVCDDFKVKINETGNCFLFIYLVFLVVVEMKLKFCRVLVGTKLKYKPGTIMGGRQHHPHDCHVSRSIGYYLEPLIVLCLFAKEPLTVRLKGSSLLFPFLFIIIFCCYCL